ncbi:CRISPR-associated endoribonuclease Cse3 [Planctomycetes bacterium Pan216]|uniref:CRISPR-associated endoribonuclease Cse3 n=1 Tax=Kolteria novifilia TaxID=2527975 RepID=A0A518B0E8_9BACT|nr:CRISPR-associated endoribonuclease Cse3 [Planctomycetes bacterium Pan216]
MYLSRLTLNPRNRGVLRDVGSPYELHRTLLRGFPDREAGGPGRVLFRLETRQDEGPPIVLAQSDKEPDWSSLVKADYTNAETTPIRFSSDSTDGDPHAVPIPIGRRFRFRLLANPTVKREGKRHGLFRDQDQIDWLRRKGDSGGFSIETVRADPVGRVSSRKGGSTTHHHAVRFEGVLQVTDPTEFIASIEAGIGSAKAFGFGLLSVAPAGGSP